MNEKQYHKYITYREVDENDILSYYILQKDHPHYKAKIAYNSMFCVVDSIRIDNYNLFLVFDFCLRGRFLPSYQKLDVEILLVMQDMANWFYENRILTDLKKYKKWKM
jgi:hypothetical protein